MMMSNGYDAFGKGVPHSKSEYLSLETMYRLDSLIKGMICTEEEARSRIQHEQETAYSEWNDVVDMELREVLDNVFLAIATAQNSYMCAQAKLHDCIQRRRDYLCSAKEAAQKNPTEGKQGETDAD